MKILVTGGAGFIGSHIVDQCVARGHEVAVLDSLWAEGGGKQQNLNPKARFFHEDITDDAALQSIFGEVRPTKVVSYQAAQHSVAISTKNPQFDASVNVLGMLNVLTNCTRVDSQNCFRLIGRHLAPFTSARRRETPQRPKSPYGITKMVAEHYLRYWQEANGLTYTALRYENIYGRRQDRGEAGVISIFARRFLNHESVRIDWDGEQQKDYVYVEDVARANHWQSIMVTTIFSHRHGRGASVNELYSILETITGYKPEIVRAPNARAISIFPHFHSAKQFAYLAGNHRKR